MHMLAYVHEKHFDRLLVVYVQSHSSTICYYYSEFLVWFLVETIIARAFYP